MGKLGSEFVTCKKCQAQIAVYYINTIGLKDCLKCGQALPDPSQSPPPDRQVKPL